jgi:hypothetical protein
MRFTLFLIVVLGMVASCGGGSSGSGGFGLGGATMCGQVQPCGGDLTGTWLFTTGCITSVGIKDAEGTPSCAGESIGVTQISVSGSITFNADMTYTASSLSQGATFSIGVPASCNASNVPCSSLATALRSSGFQTATCTGSGSCSCSAMQTAAVSETGTYTVSGSTFTATPTGGGTSMLTNGGPESYCVQGTALHAITVSTMSMGTMGQAAIDEDTVGMKQ